MFVAVLQQFSTIHLFPDTDFAHGHRIRSFWPEKRRFPLGFSPAHAAQFGSCRGLPEFAGFVQKPGFFNYDGG